jgi:multiple sugar transport system permease protein
MAIERARIDTSARSAHAPAAPMPRRRSGLHRREALMAYVFISPALILFGIFTLLPALIAIGLSLSRYDILTPPTWNGLSNYALLLSDNLFFVALKNILAYAVMFVPAMVVLSLGLALALNRKRPGMAIFRTVYYLPVVTSAVAAATVWAWLLNRDYGIVNQLLGLVGIAGPAWLSNSSTALLAVVIVTLWQGIGANMIIYLAGLQGIPDYLYEAAMLDGAGPWHMLRYITWPSLRPTTFLVTTVSLIGSFQLFDQAYVMTQGGPGDATLTPVYYIYQTGFNQLQMGYACAQAVILFLIIFAVSLINMRINRSYTLV